MNIDLKEVCTFSRISKCYSSSHYLLRSFSLKLSLFPHVFTQFLYFLYLYTGLYYHYISEDVIVGSQPRSAGDIAHLAHENNVKAILNLQQDKDLHHWGVNLHELSHASAQHGIELIRTPAVDFDPHSLRATLPTAVAAMERARRNHGRVYVHCTAGLGRSPAVAIAALYWFTDMDLDTAYNLLTSIRPCGPNKDAIRGATYDLITGGHWDHFHQLPSDAFSSLSDDERDLIREKLLGESSSSESE
jgi:protein-tyrosine phosphatase